MSISEKYEKIRDKLITRVEEPDDDYDEEDPDAEEESPCPSIL